MWHSAEEQEKLLSPAIDSNYGRVLVGKSEEQKKENLLVA